MARRRPNGPHAPDTAARALVDLSPFAQAWFDRQRRLVTCNAAWRARIGSDLATLDAFEAWLATAGGATAARLVRAESPDGLAVYLADAPGEQDAAVFLSRAAHQLRTPIASIAGFAELMARRRISPERLADAAGVVVRQSASLVRLVDLLLDLARLDARKGRDFRLAPVDLGALVSEAVAELPPGRAGERILVEAAGAPPARADRHWLRTALRELIDNACAYSPGGSPVRVRVAVAGPGRVMVQIVDTGPGIAAGDLEAAFERFHRCGGSDAPPGHGLGLGLARDIARLMAGEVTLSSHADHGTVATLELPVAAP